MSPLLNRLVEDLGSDRLALAYAVGVVLGVGLVAFALATILPASPVFE